MRSANTVRIDFYPFRRQIREVGQTAPVAGMPMSMPSLRSVLFVIPLLFLLAGVHVACLAQDSITVTIDDKTEYVDEKDQKRPIPEFPLRNTLFNETRNFGSNQENGFVIVNKTDPEKKIKYVIFSLRPNKMNYKDGKPLYKFALPAAKGPYGPFAKAELSDEDQVIVFSGAELGKGEKFHLQFQKLKGKDPQFAGKITDMAP